MSKLGYTLLKIRQLFEDGIRVTYYRDIVRPEIVSTDPIQGLGDATCEIHVLTSSDDWLNLLWALKSFYWVSERSYALCIHDDGSLEDDHRATLQEHFPNARLIERKAADARVIPFLDDYPKAKSFRQENHLAPKLFDFQVYLKSDQMLLLDSDVLFFEEPTELLWRIEDPTYQKNSVNRDVDTAYTVAPADIRAQFGFEPVPQFNSGLGLIHRDSIQLDWIEDFLEMPDIRSHFWRIEQTLYALCSSRYGVELLPQSYDVHLEEGIRGPVRHYVGAVRNLMYKEGIRKLKHKGALN
jgi:hypothetical protein